jgi:hypothetical protein
MAGDHGASAYLFTFPVVFFGSLVLAGLAAFLAHKRMGKLPRVGEARYNVFVLLLGLWCLAGLLIDATAHLSGVVDDTFFTEWHALWYSGATAYGAYIFYAVLPEGGIAELVRRPFGVLGDIAPQHRAGVWGIIIFGAAGFGDMIWHELLGVETSLDILLSPTHIGLFAGLALSVSGPMWSAWADEKSGTEGFTSQLLLAFGVGAAWTVLLILTRFSHLWIAPLEQVCYAPKGALGCESRYEDALQMGLNMVYVQAMMTAGALLLFLRRWQPARGTLLLIGALHAVGVWVYANSGPAMLVQGLIWAVILEGLRGLWMSGHRHVFMALATASQVVVGIVAALLALPKTATVRTWMEGTDLHLVPYGWSVHATFGVVVLAAFIGVIATSIVMPPDVVEAHEA